MDTTRFFLYARKSTDDLSRQVRSIDDQIAELREVASREQLEIVDVLIEKQTAKAPGRPVFNAMLDRIEKGEASAILAWHPDRLTRNSIDAGRLIHLLDTRNITTLRFATFPFDPSASGKFMLSIMFGQSKYYVDNLSENIRRGQRQKLKNGIWPILAPIGYLNDHATKTIYPDPQRAPLVRKAFELHATGTYTLDRLVETVNGLGLVNRKGDLLSRTQYHRMLRNSLYCGIIRFSKEDYEGSHETIITKELFDQVQQVMTRKSKPKARGFKSYLYRGVFLCQSCGCFITVETQKGHNYLRCTKRVQKDCPEPYVREEAIAQQVVDQLRHMALPIDAANRMIAALEAERDRDIHSRQDCITAIRDRIADAERKLERLMQAYLDESVSLTEFRESKAKLVGEKQKEKDELAAAEANRESWFEPAIRFVNASKLAIFLAESGRDDQRRDFLKKHGSNLTISNRRLNMTPRQPWELVVDQGYFGQNKTPAPAFGAGAFTETRSKPDELELAERQGFNTHEICKVLASIYLRLKSGGFEDLTSLKDLLLPHGFLPSIDEG